MDFGTAVTTCFWKYVDFTGRARRSEFWWFTLFAFVLVGIARILDSAIDPGIEVAQLHGGYAYVCLIAIIALPWFAVSARRLHDTDRSGLWILLGLLPIIGEIILIIWFVSSGTGGFNQHGPDPTAPPIPG